MTTIQDRSGIAIARVATLGRSAMLAALAILAAAVLPAADAAAKTPGSTYCFHGTCHRVRSIAETHAMVGRTEQLSTSFYDDCKRDRYNPCGLTSSGERFRADQPDNAASPIYPDGTTLLVFNPATQRAAVLRVNNAGPYWGSRKLDVSRAAADKLGFRGKGVAKLQVKVLKAPTKAEATYRKNRKYEPVAGYVGQFASLDAAAGGLTSVAALKAVTTAIVAPVTRQTRSEALAALDLNLPSLTGATGPRPAVLRDQSPRTGTAVADSGTPAASGPAKRKKLKVAAGG